MSTTTTADLAELVVQLPLGRRQLLARGPMLPGEMQAECRVCEALGEPWNLMCMAGGPPWIKGAALPLFDYHAAEGNRGEAAYARCVEIYRAAGWTGEYDARDLHGFEGDDG